MIPRFRVWDKDRRVVAGVKDIYFNDNGKITCWIFFDDNKGLYQRILEETAELMQSTGLFDKNGKEIFEGDIIKGVNNDGHIQEEYLPTKIIFKGGCFVSEYWNKPITSKETEVIGNIFGNPELLKEDL